MNAIDIVKEQVKAYEKGIAHAVVTIVHSDGSTPRTNGKMLVYSNGATKGTIGGGNVECIATSDALQCIREGCNRLKQYDMTSEASETGMTCGPIWNGGRNREEELLANCYFNSMKLAMDNGIRSIAFPSISTGAYGFPVELAANIAAAPTRRAHAHPA